MTNYSLPLEFCFIFIKISDPTETPFDGGVFNAVLCLPDEYPIIAPKVLFRIKIYLQNIDKLARICLDILKDKRSLTV